MKDNIVLSVALGIIVAQLITLSINVSRIVDILQRIEKRMPEPQHISLEKP